jgi:hypothetical protein
MMLGLAAAVRIRSVPVSRVPQQPFEAVRDGLVERICALDGAYATGRMGEDRYQIERASLITRLARVLMDREVSKPKAG